MNKVLNLILTLTMVFSLLCTPVFAETTNLGIINSDPAVEEDYFSEFIDDSFKVDYLILVSSQYGKNKINIFGFGSQK